MINTQPTPRMVPAKVCAWCGKILSTELVGELYQSHGICPSCASSVVARHERQASVDRLDEPPLKPVWPVVFFASFATAALGICALIVWAMLR